MKSLKSMGLLAGLACGVMAAVPVMAQTYPSKPIRILIPNPAGAASDVTMRGITNVIGQTMGATFIIENRPGADGTIAGKACVDAAPDGHTLCMLDAFNVALNPAIHKSLPYDTVNDLKPIMNIGFFAAGLWANKNLPVNSAEELFALAKKEPGKLNFASFGAASSSSIYVAWLKNVKNIEFTNVSYKAALEAFRAVVNGEADVASFALGAGINNSKPGEIKLLAINNPTRMPQYPNVPTFTEAGINGVLAWFGLFAPKGTPDAIVNRLSDEISKHVMQVPAVRERVIELPGLQVIGPAGKPPAEFAKFIRDEVAVYAKLVSDAKIEKQ